MATLSKFNLKTIKRQTGKDPKLNKRSKLIKAIEEQIEKTKELRSMVADRPIHIQIDGGVTPETAPLVSAAGADVLVAGSAVFKGGSVANPGPYGHNIRAIRAAAKG